MQYRLITLLIIFGALFTTAFQPKPTPTILITELFYNTPGDDSLEEWIELTNLTAAPINLSNYKLGDEETAGGYEGMLRFPTDAVIEAGQTIIIAQTAADFQRRYGQPPTYEIQETDPAVPNMHPFPTLADGDLGLANDGDEVLLLNEQDRLVDALNYGDSHHYFDPSIAAVFTGQSIERTFANCDTNTAADWQPQETPTPFEITLSDACAQPSFEETPPIGQIQGAADTAPAVNQRLTVQGTVIGRHADTNASGITFHTLYLQDSGDDDPATSDGLAVFFGRQAPDAAVGDQLHITGQLTEYFGLTEIADDNLHVQTITTDHPLPAPLTLTENLPPGEALEGMLVTIPTATVIGPTYHTNAGCGFAVSLDRSTRFIQHTAEADSSHIVPILWHDETACDEMPAVKTGDTISGLTGPLTYNFDQFRLIHQPDYPLTIDPAPFPNPPQPPTPTADQFSIATLNMENFFDSEDDTGTTAEPKLTAAEITLKQTKLAHTISDTLHCPTLIAVQEVEKEHLLLNLAEALTAACGFTYQVTHRESIDVRGIDTALLSDPAQVTIQSAALKQGCSPISTDLKGFDCPAGEEPLFSRPPLAVTLTVDGYPLTVIVNHFKSKRGGAAETEPRRIAQAEHVVSLVENLPHDAIVLGDFNDYADSRPLHTLTSGTLTNLLRHLPENDQYSFVFSGSSQLIDGILTTPELTQNTAAVHILHINADYPDALATDTTPEFLPFKSTDHDPALVIFNLPQPQPTPTPPPTNTPPPTSTPEPASTLPSSPSSPSSPPPNRTWLLSFPLALTGLAAFWLLFKRK